MKTRRNFFIVLSLAFLVLVGLFSCGYSTVSAEQDRGKDWKNLEEWNAVKPGKFVIEPPTLICLGFKCYIEGDANHNKLGSALDIGHFRYVFFYSFS